MSEWITSASGRLFKRNNENTGTIMQWNNNDTIINTIIYDAKYRIIKKFYGNSANLKLPEYHNIGYFTPTMSKIAPPVLAIDYTDKVLNQKSMCNQDNRSNNAATSEIISAVNALILDPEVAEFGRNNCSAIYCRLLQSLNITGCDLPTVNCMVRIYGDMVILDQLDPTIQEFPEYALSNWFSKYRTSTSSVYKNNNETTDVLYVCYDGRVNFISQNADVGVIPVLDINL